jgi:hypothetical protein
MRTPSLVHVRWLALLPLLRHPPAPPMSVGAFGQDEQRLRAETQSRSWVPSRGGRDPPA